MVCGWFGAGSVVFLGSSIIKDPLEALSSFDALLKGAQVRPVKLCKVSVCEGQSGRLLLLPKVPSPCLPSYLLPNSTISAWRRCTITINTNTK